MTAEQIIELFREKYQPAADLSEATDFLDTEEIFSAIAKIVPGSKIKKEQLFSLLEAAGYKVAAQPNVISFNLKWLLIRQY